MVLMAQDTQKALACYVTVYGIHVCIDACTHISTFFHYSQPNKLRKQRCSHPNNKNEEQEPQVHSGTCWFLSAESSSAMAYQPTNPTNEYCWFPLATRYYCPLSTMISRDALYCIQNHCQQLMTTVMGRYHYKPLLTMKNRSPCLSIQNLALTLTKHCKPLSIPISHY